jgi:hypothetical protein
MTLWRTFWNWYFEPKAFETRGDGRLYRLVGIRFFKRYLPTSGDLVRRWRGRRRVPALRTDIAADLLRHEKRTRSYEARHLFGAASMLLVSWWSITFHGRGSWFVLIPANILINGYPILLQRYNRIRLRSVLERRHARS